MKTSVITLGTLLTTASLVLAATSIEVTNSYSYGANVGWINWVGDTNNGAVVGAKVCSGYIYSANVGWINLGSGSPTNRNQYSNLSSNDFGVNVDTSGNLRGYAYGANIGWINFETNGAPKVDWASGYLSGYAYGANVGWISLSNSFAVVQTTSRIINYDCAGAITLTNGSSYCINTATATATDSPGSGCTPVTKGVWYQYTPPLTGTGRVSTCGSDFDTALLVYIGNCDGLTLVACNNDNGPGCAGNPASVDVVFMAGLTYYVLAGGYNNAHGNLCTTITSPWNDDCGGAIALTDGVQFAMSTTNATGTGDTNTCPSAVNKGVWFTYTAPTSGPLLISTLGSSFDTMLNLYGGVCGGSMTRLACNDDNGPAGSGIQASLSLNAVQGATYYILAGGYSTYSGNLAIVASLQAPISVTTKNHTNISISWSGGGTLQYSTNIAPGCAWNYVTSGVNIWSEPMTNGMKFFRVIYPNP